MRKINIPLLIGSLILIIILLVMIMPDVFAERSPYNVQQLRFKYDNGEREIMRAPYAPSKEFLLGSDRMGRDILSQIIYGTRLTILLGVLVALGRFLIAVPVALSAGFGNEGPKALIRQSSIVFSAIPALLICVIILSLNFFVGLSKTSSIFAFVVVMSLVGWPKLSVLLSERVAEINVQPFIRGEVAIGKSRIKIALENVLPHLAPEMIVLFFMEIARTLAMIMQLGVFSVFVGNLRIIRNTEGGVISFYNFSFEPEWAGMLSTSRNLISVAPWAVLFPALAFFISVMGFNLFGEGLRNVMQKKNTEVIPAFRKIISLNMKSMWHSYSAKTKWVTLFVALGIFAAAILPNVFLNAEYKFGQITKVPIPYQTVIIGTEEAKSITDMIVDKMQALNIESLDDDENYRMHYAIDKACVVNSHTFTIKIGENTITPKNNIDFHFVTAGNLSAIGGVYDATTDDLLSIDDYEKFKNEFILVDTALYNAPTLNYIAKDISNHVAIKGLLLIAGHNDVIDNHILNISENIVSLLITRDLAQTLIDDKSAEVEIAANVRALGQQGTNVIGVHRATDPLRADEAIMIGMRYNYLDQDGETIMHFNLELMERLCTQFDNKRSIIFVFLDGAVSDKFHGSYSLAEDLPYSPAKVEVYLDLTGISTATFDDVIFSAGQAPFTRQYAWSMAHHIEKRLSEENIIFAPLEAVFFGTEYYFTAYPSDNAMFWDRGIASIQLKTGSQGQGKHSIDKLGSIILEVISKSNY